MFDVKITRDSPRPTGTPASVVAAPGPAAASDLSCAAPAATSPTTASTAIRRRSHRTRLPLISPQSMPQRG